VLPMSPEWTGESWSGRLDLNQRPLGPEPNWNVSIAE
jgi:hypothetical protein